MGEDINKNIELGKKFRIAVVLMFIPVVINIFVTVSSLISRGPAEFRGYLMGTLLSLMFSLAWVIMARKVTLSNIMVLFTVSLGSFPVKILFFALVFFIGWKLLDMDQLYFGISFLFGSMMSLFIEVWFILSVNKLKIRQKGLEKKSAHKSEQS